ncbi:MAG: bifunctional folylpolyglutamate synthase/dihydrofolate synthase [Candidatus Parcubacteria bacterium]|nr:bifunctional folylpolyglutamate synthase/dihydrofolate synthase [Leptolyngbyaceae cyanobacterium LF-bin-113]
MTHSSIDSFLEKFERFGVNLGLEAIQHLLAELDNPHDRVPIIHVAGSNGKGSVCAYLSAVLTEAGYRVGRYTSPHLVSWCERICIRDQPISPEKLHEVLQQVEAAICPDRPSPTQFEVITAAMWLYFAQQKVDLAVIEVGLGGRLDATNVCDRPLVTVITSLSMEHWQRLGPTLTDIAREKAGILKSDCPAVIGQIPSEAAAVVNRRVLELNCPTIYPQPAKDLGGSWAEYQGMEEYELKLETGEEGSIELIKSFQYQLPLQGAIQLHNSALAIAALQLLRQEGWEFSDEAITDGIANTKWAGRLQWSTYKEHQILIDGAHNPASAEVLRQFVNTLKSSSIHWVMGMLSTKDHADVFKELLRSGDRLSLVPVPGHSSANPQELAVLAKQICPELADCCVYENVFSALETAIEKSGQDPIVLCGSLYLIGDFFEKTAR